MNNSVKRVFARPDRLDVLLGITTGPSYLYAESNAGRHLSKRPKQSSDCTVRALVHAFGISYDAAYDLMRLQGRKCHEGAYYYEEYLNKQPWAELVRGTRKDLTVVEAANTFKTGIYLILVKGHVFCLKDGVVWDELVNAPERRVEYVYRVDPSKFSVSETALDSLINKVASKSRKTTMEMFAQYGQKGINNG